MAKKRAPGEKTKAEHIQEYASQNPQANAPAIQTALADRGIEVSLPTAYRALGEMEGSTPAGQSVKKKSAKKKRAKKKGRRKAGRTAATTAAPAKAGRTGELSFSALQEAKNLADQLGGVEQAKKALDALARLQ